MTLTVDNLNTLTGWTPSDITKFHIELLNEHRDYIANDLSGSILIHSINGLNETLTKTFTAINVTDYQELVLSVYSVRLGNTGWYYNDLDDFKYKIRFNSTMTYYMLPTFSSLQAVTFDISDLTSIDRIELVCNHALEDYLVISWCVVNKDQLPLDIYIPLKVKLESQLNNLIGVGYLIEALDLALGDTEITFSSNMPYIEKYACVYITDGVNTETHQLFKNDELNFKLSSMYDGKSILHNYTGASVYVLPKIEYGQEKEISIPSIFISNLVPNPIISAKIENEYDSYKADRTLSVRPLPQVLKWNINIDCISRHNSILADLSEIIRKVISNKTLWINGKKFEIDFEGNPVFQDFTEITAIYPKITYVMNLETKEYFVDRTVLPNTTSIITTINIEEQ